MENQIPFQSPIKVITSETIHINHLFCKELKHAIFMFITYHLAKIDILTKY